jgi:hypothetical protein
MLHSAKRRSQNNNASRSPNRPSSDPIESSEERSISQDTSQPKEDSLVEQILEFLDRYPARFVPRSPMREHIRA